LLPAEENQHAFCAIREQLVVERLQGVGRSHEHPLDR
jgi:hypothetical protein